MEDDIVNKIYLDLEPDQLFFVVKTGFVEFVEGYFWSNLVTPESVVLKL